MKFCSVDNTICATRIARVDSNDGVEVRITKGELNQTRAGRLDSEPKIVGESTRRIGGSASGIGCEKIPLLPKGQRLGSGAFGVVRFGRLRYNSDNKAEDKYLVR